MDSNEIIRLLDEVSVRLEGPAKYTFELVARRVAVEGLVATLGGAVILVGLVVAITIGARLSVAKYRRDYKNWEERVGDDEFKRSLTYKYDKPDLDGYAFSWFIVAIPSAIVGFFLVGSILSGLIKLLTPEYAAIERVMSFLP